MMRTVPAVYAESKIKKPTVIKISVTVNTKVPAWRMGLRPNLTNKKIEKNAPRKVKKFNIKGAIGLKLGTACFMIDPP